jgi:hypothetical protein
MAGAVGKLDGVFGDVMPKNSYPDLTLVPVESPALGATHNITAKLLN